MEAQKDLIIEKINHQCELIENLLYQDYLRKEVETCEMIQELVKRIRKAKQDFGKNCFIYLCCWGNSQSISMINQEMKMIKSLSRTQNIEWLKDEEDINDFEIEKSNFKAELSFNVAIFIKR